MTGGAAGVSQATITGTLTNPTNVIQTATYSVTPVSGAAGACQGATFTVTVTVYPKPFVTPRTEAICSGGTFTTTPVNNLPATTTIVPSNTTYTWTFVDNTSVTGESAQATGQSSIIQTLTNISNTVQTVVYTVTPKSGDTGLCVGSTFTITVTVYPKPVIPNQTSTTCSDTAFTVPLVNASPTTATIVPASTTYTWTVADNTNVTGDLDQPTAQTSISQTLTNSTNVAQTVVYTVTPVSGTTGTCLGANFTLTVTVNPKPTVASETTAVCSGNLFTVSPSTGVNGNIIATGTKYTWPLPVVTGGLTGGAIGTAQNSISGTLTNITNVAQTATYTVTPTSGSCNGPTFTAVVTVNPKPVIPAQTATICSATAFTTSPVNNIIGTSGIAGNALNFDGNNDYVVSNVSGISYTDFTIEAYIKPDGTSQSTKGVLQWANTW
jgi:hypothetical protein